MKRQKLEGILCLATKNLIDEKKVCFALSGGMDSTTLVVLAAKYNLTSSLVCYTANDKFGNDLHYAKLVADKLNLDLRVVDVPVGEKAVDLHFKLSQNAGTALSLVGNSIGFASICRQAAADGFDAIVDGTGAGTTLAGNTRFASTFMHLAQKEARNSALESFNSRNNSMSKKRWKKINAIPPAASMAEAIQRDFTAPDFLKWFAHHKVTEQAVGIEILMPYLTPEMDAVRDADFEFFFKDGWFKSPLRTILRHYIGPEMADRPDDQGFRWPRKKVLVNERGIMTEIIRKHDGLKALNLFEQLSLKTRLGTIGHHIRLYEKAVDYIVKQEKQNGS